MHAPPLCSGRGVQSVGRVEVEQLSFAADQMPMNERNDGQWCGEIFSDKRLFCGGPGGPISHARICMSRASANHHFLLFISDRRTVSVIALELPGSNREVESVWKSPVMIHSRATS